MNDTKQLVDDAIEVFKGRHPSAKPNALLMGKSTLKELFAEMYGDQAQGAWELRYSFTYRGCFVHVVKGYEGVSAALQ